jgi:ABC-type enterochelin transport system ATPase subunit
MEEINMGKNFDITKQDENIVISLTVKELLSLAGDKFAYDKSLLIEARKKIKKQLEEVMNS